jgi:Mn-dependent DtxR family transcriptional regulator
VRRAGVTQAAQKLQERGLIRYQRGNVTDPGSERAGSVCVECFRVLREEYDRLLGVKDRDG